MFKIVEDDGCPASVKAFADDIALLISSNTAAAMFLRAASIWAAEKLMRFNPDQCKSSEMIDQGKHQKLCRTLGGEALRDSQSAKYL